MTPPSYSRRVTSRTSSYSSFVQDEIAIVRDRLSLTIGSKFLHNSYSGFGSRARRTNPVDAKSAAKCLGCRYPRRAHSLPRGRRSPAHCIRSPEPAHFLPRCGDRGFSSENLIGYEAGYRSLVKPKFYVDIAAFYNNYDHLLSLEPGAPFSENSPTPTHTVVPLYFRNGLFGKTSGFEIAPDWTPINWWRLRGSYSYLYMDLNKHSGSLDTATASSTEGSSPHHQIVIQSSVDLPKKLEFDQTLRYVSALLPSEWEPTQTGDVRFSWRAVRSMEFSVVGQNLLQPHHPETAGDPGLLLGWSGASTEK